MSLDFYLEGDPETRTCTCRECWTEHMVTERPVLYDRNITHNLGRMAREAGVYMHLWRPEEIGVTRARELIEPLREALWRLEADPDRFREHDAPNGWGTYEHFVPFVRDVLAACREHPDAYVSTSR